MTESTDRPRDRRGFAGWVQRHPWIMLTLSVLILAILAVVALDRAAERSLERCIAEIRARGEPVTLDDLKDANPVIPDDENMALAMLDHLKPLAEFKPPSEHPRIPIVLSSTSRAPTGERLSPEELEAAKWYVDHFASGLGVIHKALRLEQGAFPITWASPAINILLPHLSLARHASRAICVETLVAAEEGDSPRAAAMLHDLCMAPRILDHEPFLISALVQAAMDAVALDELERTINLCGLSSDALGRLEPVVRQMEPRPNLARSMMTERVVFLDTLQWARKTGGAGLSGVPAAATPFASATSNVWGWVPVLPELDVCAGLQFYNELTEALRAPVTAETIIKVRAIEARTGSLPPYCVLSKIMMPSISRAVELHCQSIGRERAMCAALACERYRLKHGDWPADLAALAPEFLDAVPVDPFDDQPIRYAQIPEGIKVWTIGEDMTDNGGDVKRLERQSSSNRPTDWGWVILNPDLRGRPAADDEPNDKAD